MSFCFMMQSKSDVMKYIKNHFSAHFDARQKFHMNYYCYDDDFCVFSYDFSNVLIKAELENHCVNFYLSDIAVGIFQSLINNNIEFNFALADLKHKEDEELIFRNLIKNPEIKYKLNTPYRIIERQLYCMR